MTRWCHGYRGKRRAAQRMTHKLMEHEVVPTLLAEDFKYPSAALIRSSQLRHEEHAPRNTNKKGKELWTVESKVWVPDHDKDLH